MPPRADIAITHVRPEADLVLEDNARLAQVLPSATGIRKLHIPNARSGIKKSNHYAMSMGATLGRFSNAAAAEVL
jgi:hypothetical protein